MSKAKNYDEAAVFPKLNYKISQSSFDGLIIGHASQHTG
jgi:hypothetical protein